MKIKDFNHLGVFIQSNIRPFSLMQEVGEYEESCITHVDADIFYVSDSEIKPHKIGYLKAVFLNIPKIENDDVSCLCNLIQASNTKFLYKGLIDAELHNVYEKFEEHNPDYFISNGIFIIKKIEILEKYRGNKIALSVIHQMVEKLNFGANLVVMNVKEEKLKNYFSFLDFKQVGKTNTLVLSTALIRPFIGDVLDFNLDKWKKSKKEKEKELVKNELYEQAAKVRDEIMNGQKIEKI